MADRSARMPEWVVTRDGRRAPFDPDAISQALFAATEALGRPNAFLARELTDAVLHFLAQDAAAEVTTAEIADHVEKVVRGLDQPAVAQAFADRRRAGTTTPTTGRIDFPLTGSPDQLVRHTLRAYSLQAVFSRDLAAAEADGLLILHGLDAPARLASAAVEAPGDADLLGFVRSLRQAAAVAGGRVVIDAADWHPLTATEPDRFLHALRDAPALSERDVVVNVNSADPPAWAQPSGAGPLFAHERREAPAARGEWLSSLIAAWTGDRARLDWHVQARDFDDESARERLRSAVAAPNVAVVFDRPRRPVALAEGMDRRQPAVLMAVGLNLPALLERAEVAGDGEAFVRKLPSLARMAVRVGAQKRKFLRTQAPPARGFLVDRSRLLVTPVGLDAVVQSISGAGVSDSSLSLDVARRVAQALADSLRDAGRAAHLDVALDGVDAADGRHDPVRQVQAAGKLHAVTGGGTAVVRLAAGVGVDELMSVLHVSWKRTEIARLRFERGGDAVTQGEFGE